MRQRASLIPATVALLASTSLVQAEIGVPTAPGGVYLSVGSGYHHENGSNVAADGMTTTGPGNGRGAAPTGNGINSSSSAASTGGSSAATGNGSGSASFAGGNGASNASSSATFFSGPGGSAASSSANGRNNVSSGSNATLNGGTAVAGGYMATQASAMASNTTAGTSASATASGSYGAFALANANLSGSLGVAAAGGAGATAASSAADARESISSSSDGGSFLKAQDGAFGSAEIGYVLPSAFHGVTRVEIYVTGSMATQSSPIQGGFGFRGVDNRSALAVAATPFGAVGGSAFQRERLGEIGVRIKADRQVGRVFAAVSAEPFYLDFRQLTATSAGGAGSFGQRVSSVYGQLYGGQVAAEAVLPVLRRVSLVGRASAGLYGTESSGVFSSVMGTTAGNQTVAAIDATAATSNFAFLSNATAGLPRGGQFAGYVSDSRSNVGVRLGAQGGVRYEIAPAAWFTVLGSVDYLSDVPTAVLPRYATDPAAHLATRGFVDLRIGGRLTVATLGAS